MSHWRDEAWTTFREHAGTTRESLEAAMEAVMPRLMKDDAEREAMGVTLATIKAHVEHWLKIDNEIVSAGYGQQEHMRGQRKAFSDIKAILDAHRKPPGEQVTFGAS